MTESAITWELPTPGSSVGKSSPSGWLATLRSFFIRRFAADELMNSGSNQALEQLDPVLPSSPGGQSGLK